MVSRLINNRGSLADQPRPVAEQIRGNTPTIRQVINVTASIAGKDKPAAIKMAKQQSLMWVQKRVGKLTETAWSFEDFEHLIPGCSAAAVTIKRENIDYWVVRCDDPDKKVAGRTWTTEITVALKDNQATFGLRLMATGRGDLSDFIPSVPGIVRQVSENPGLVRIGRTISDLPWIIKDNDSLNEMLDLIEDSKRKNPVYVVSLNEYEDDPKTASIDVFDIAKRCIGIAHIVVVPGELTYGISDRFGKMFSVYRGAVRTYKTGFNLDEDTPFTHPIALPETIKQWEGGGADGFVAMLARNAASESLARIDHEKDLPSFSKVKQHAIEMRRETAVDDELLNLAYQEIEEKGKQSAEWEGMALEEEEKRKDVEHTKKELESRLYWLQKRNDDLETKIKEITNKSTDHDTPIPESLDELGDWTNKYLAGRIIMAGRALRSAKGAVFDDVGLVYKALLLLANEYREKMLGKGQEAFDKKLEELGLGCSATFAGGLAGEQGDTYFLKHEGRKRELNMHLKYGNAHNESRCMRVYFFWDEERSLAVVGSLPAHLRTRAT